MLFEYKATAIDRWIEQNEPVFALLRHGATQVAKEDGVFMVLMNVDTYARAQNQTVSEVFDELVERVGDLGVAQLELSYGGWDCSPRIMLAPK